MRNAFSCLVRTPEAMISFWEQGGRREDDNIILKWILEIEIVNE